VADVQFGAIFTSPSHADINRVGLPASSPAQSSLLQDQRRLRHREGSWHAARRHLHSRCANDDVHMKAAGMRPGAIFTLAAPKSKFEGLHLGAIITIPSNMHDDGVRFVGVHPADA
jgi:hypothetical protein